MIILVLFNWVGCVVNLLNNDAQNHCDLEQLALLAQKSDDESFNSLVDGFLPVIKIKASKFTQVETDDLVQEGLLGLWSAVQTYDKEKSASFKTYANKCINNRMITVASKIKGKKHIPRELIISLEDSNFTEITGGLSPEQSMIDRESYLGMIKRVKSLLSSTEFSVLGYYLAGYSYEQIAKKLGTNAKAVDNALQRIRCKLKH